MVRREPLISVLGLSPLAGPGDEGLRDGGLCDEGLCEEDLCEEEGLREDKGLCESGALEDFFRQDPQQLGLPAPDQHGAHMVLFAGLFPGFQAITNPALGAHERHFVHQ